MTLWVLRIPDLSGRYTCNFIWGVPNQHNVMLIRINFECFNFVAVSGVGACCLGHYADLNLESNIIHRCAV